MPTEYKDQSMAATLLGTDKNLLGAGLITGVPGTLSIIPALRQLKQTESLTDYKKLMGEYYREPSTPKLYPTAHNIYDATDQHYLTRGADNASQVGRRVVRDMLRNSRINKRYSPETLLAKLDKTLAKKIPNTRFRQAVSPFLKWVYKQQTGIGMRNAAADIGHNRLILTDGKLPSSGILAHELGHMQSKLGKNKILGPMMGVGPMLGSFSALLPARAKTENKAVAGATLGSLMFAPRLVEELGASYRGAKLLRNAGLAGGPTLKGKLGLLKPFVGIPSYLAAGALPFATYGVKKYRGGYDQPATTKLASVFTHSRYS